MHAFLARLTAWLLLATAATASAGDGREGRFALQVQHLSESAHPDAWLLAAWMAKHWCHDASRDCAGVRSDLLVERLLADPPTEAVVLQTFIAALPTLLEGDPVRQARERERLLALAQALRPQALESWLPALPDPSSPQRAQGPALLARAAASTDTLDHWGEGYRWIVSRLPELPPKVAPDAVAEPPMDERRETAFALSAALILPGHVELMRWCRDPGATWAGDCRSIGRLLAASDTLLGRKIGVAILKHVAATDAEGAEALRLAARVDWLFSAHVTCGALDNSASLYDGEGVSEIDIIEADLLARGLPLEPPQDPVLLARPCARDDASAAANPREPARQKEKDANELVGKS